MRDFSSCPCINVYYWYKMWYASCCHLISDNWPCLKSEQAWKPRNQTGLNTFIENFIPRLYNNIQPWYRYWAKTLRSRFATNVCNHHLRLYEDKLSDSKFYIDSILFQIIENLNLNLEYSFCFLSCCHFFVLKFIPLFWAKLSMS